jgi:hypothetical protein
MYTALMEGLRLVRLHSRLFKPPKRLKPKLSKPKRQRVALKR